MYDLVLRGGTLVTQDADVFWRVSFQVQVT